MPRDGTQTYILPFPDVVADTTIESPVYNGFTNDVAQDLNLPRPIVAGGTGATSAASALANLGGEMAGQLVTNYDSFPFKAGSFYSAVGATSAPNGTNAFRGTVIITDASNMHITARDAVTGNEYVRFKAAGLWGVWSLDGGANTFVRKDGDTMTGNLTISTTDPGLLLSKPAGAHQNSIAGYLGGTARWQIAMGNGTAESGSNVGSDFAVYNFNDAGVNIGTPFSISRSTGNAAFSGNVNATNTIASIAVYSGVNSATVGTYYFGSNGTKYLNYDGTQFNFNGGPVVVPELYSNGRLTGTTAGVGAQLRLIDQTTGTSKYLRSNANNLEVINNAFSGVIMSLTDAGGLNTIGGMSTTSMSCSSLSCGGTATASGFQTGSTSLGPTSLELGSTVSAGSAFIDFHSGGNAGDFDSRILSSGGTGIGNGAMTYAANNGHNFQGPVNTNASLIAAGSIEAQGGLYAMGHRNRQGISAVGYGANWWNLFWTSGTNIQVWIDNTNIGNLNAVSDYRTKKDITALPGMWKTVKALRPIKYTHKDFTPPSEQARAKETGKPFMTGDDIERWGFVAHELQETLVDSAASGVKDAPNAIQSPDMVPVIAALTKALQEAMTRIEALEAR